MYACVWIHVLVYKHMYVFAEVRFDYKCHSVSSPHTFVETGSFIEFGVLSDKDI